ncbi:MAG: hypothetical protein WCG55_04205 [bacterium]
MAKKIGTIVFLTIILIALLWGMRELMHPRVVEGDSDMNGFITNLKK